VIYKNPVQKRNAASLYFAWVTEQNSLKKETPFRNDPFFFDELFAMLRG